MENQQLIQSHTILYNKFNNQNYFAGDITGAAITVTMDTFLKINMTGKIILNVLLPPLSNEYKFFSYKVRKKSA